MTTQLWGKLASRLSTMGGYPGWSETMADNYCADLLDLPDGVVSRMIPQVQKKFDDRPSVKQLREWARDLARSRTFDIRQIAGPPPAPARRNAPRLEAPSGGVAAFAAQVLPPAAAREVIARLKAHGGETNDGPNEYGLQFEILPGFKGAGRVSRTHHSYTQGSAQNSAEDRNAKWPHQRTSVFRKGDPLPARTPSVGAAEQDLAIAQA